MLTEDASVEIRHRKSQGLQEAECMRPPSADAVHHVAIEHDRLLVPVPDPED